MGVLKIIAITTLVFSNQGLLPNVDGAGLPNHLHHFIESPKLSHWGEWGKLEHCPSDQVVVGMRLKVHDNQGLKDDTGLNAVKFYCQNPYSSLEYSDEVLSISSLVGSSGQWKRNFYCPRLSKTKLLAVGFQLRSESSSGVKDDTAGNNLKLICSDLYQRHGYTVLEGDGTARGEWTKQQLCWPGYAICGLQTQVEVTRSMDTTGLNNLKVRCCKVDSSVANEVGKTDNRTVHLKESSSSEDSFSDSSASDEHASRKDPVVHQSDPEEGGHENDSVENSDNPAEQELIAIDPEPTEFSTSNESPNPINNITSPESQSVLTQPEGNAGINKGADESEDDNLPEEIARIEPVDNSEAHHEEDFPSTASYSHQDIPQDIINVLEDADSVDMENKSDDSSKNNSIHMVPDNDFGKKSIDQKMILHQIPNSGHITSARLGEIEIINTNSTPAASKASLIQQTTVSPSLAIFLFYLLAMFPF